MIYHNVYRNRIFIIKHLLVKYYFNYDEKGKKYLHNIFQFYFA